MRTDKHRGKIISRYIPLPFRLQLQYHCLHLPIYHNLINSTSTNMDAETKPVSTSALDILADAANDHCKTESETSNQANQTIISTSTAKRSAKAVPTPRNRTRAEQIRREALEESLTEYFPVENVRAVERMTDKEIVDSKNLVMCFLSGRAPPPPASADEETANDDEGFDAKKDINSRYVNEYQHDLSDLTRSYHYKYDPSLPLPPSFLDRPRPPAEKKRNRADDHKLKDKQTKKKRQKSKTKESFEEKYISKIDGAPLLLAYPQPNESIGHDTDEDGACEATYISNVPAIVNIKDNNVTDESVHSSVVADEASVLTTNPTSYSFEWDQDNKGWRCKRCSAVPPFFQAADAFIPGSSEPSPKSMHTHKNACLGEKADLTNALDMVLKMVR